MVDREWRGDGELSKDEALAKLKQRFERRLKKAQEWVDDRQSELDKAEREMLEVKAYLNKWPEGGYEIVLDEVYETRYDCSTVQREAA